MNFQSQQEHNLVPIMNPILVSSDGGNKVNILGIPMVIRIHGRDTGGVVSAVESHDVPGGGPPPHIHHREDETFQVLEGEYEWTVGGKTFIAKKGATIFAPRCMNRRLGRGNADSLQIRDRCGKRASHVSIAATSNTAISLARRESGPLSDTEWQLEIIGRQRQ